MENLLGGSEWCGGIVEDRRGAARNAAYIAADVVSAVGQALRKSDKG